MSNKILVVFVIFCITTAAAFDVLFIPNLPDIPFNYANIPFPIDIINNLSNMDNTPANNPITDHGATLGRVLFYDVDLSANRTISCASCHKQEFSFSDTARFSVGFNGALTNRNSMGLIHARFQRDSSFFWDNRAASLEAQTLMPVVSSVEMGLTLDTLVARISSKPFYSPLFKNAFGDSVVTTDRISKALAQFIRSMNTFGSKFRVGVDITNGPPESTPFSNFTAQENLGKDLFMDINRGNCQACHTRNVMVQQGAQNIGLDLVYLDNGVGAASGRRAQNGKFSVPSLINVELTPPYMHDGRFKTLEEVVDFYSDSVKAHPNLSGFLREIIPGTINPNNNTCDTCPPRRPHFTPVEKAALVAFLKTFRDTIITNDPRWSNPFGECATHNSLTVSSCGSYVWFGTTYTSSGVYIKSYVNTAGCVSADTLKLTVKPVNAATVVSSCGNYVWLGTTYTSSGTYTKTYTNTSGCLTTDTLKLTVKPVNAATVASSCGSYVWLGTTYTSSGTYTKTYTNTSGCLTTDTLKLTVKPVNAATVASSCGSYVWLGTTYTSSGTYTKTYTNTSGCLTTDTLKLSIKNKPLAPASITISQVSNQCGSRIYRYTAPALALATNNNVAATGYYWTMPTGPVGSTGVIDSGTVSSRIIRIRYSSNAAATSLDSIRVSFTSTCGNSTHKAVKLSNLKRTGCSNRVMPDQTVASDWTLSAFPNPSANEFSVQLKTKGGHLDGISSYSIMDDLGRVLEEGNITVNATIQVGYDLEPGTYYLVVIFNDEKKITRLLKRQ